MEIIFKKRQIFWATRMTLIFILLFYLYQIIGAYIRISQIESMIPELKQSIVQKKFKNSLSILEEMNKKISKTESNINRMFPFTKIPGISNEIKAARSILLAGNLTLDSGILGIEWLNSAPIILEDSFSSISELNEDQRKELLGYFENSSKIWEKVNSNTSLSIVQLDIALEKTSFPIISSKIQNVASTLKTYQEIFLKIEPWMSIATSMLGYPNEKTYLLLLQNNTELRPTGGFIGTYGVLKIKNADVSEFSTDNVYNLDEPSKSYNNKIPPLPIQKYIKQSQWFFRDSNWDPDFPTSAQRAIQFYKDEKGPIKHFDGVIAFTPDLIEDILTIVGPIYVDDKEFTSENLVDTLAYHVEKGFVEKGITIYNRKKIIDDVAQQIKEKIFSLETETIKKMIPIIFKNLSEKQLMLWFENKEAQKTVDNFNWSNKIIETKKDYIYVVDANLGSLKSDPAIEKTINYTLNIDNEGNFLSNISITYKHTKDFDWKTTRYRTYTRVYVPFGAKLINAKGNEEEIKITDEHNKTVFGTFISIEPGETETLSFTYKLPTSVVDNILMDKYELLVQKQAGANPHTLNFNITLPFEVDKAMPNEILKKKSSNNVLGTTRLLVDQKISVTQK